jgi:uncharacterized heparinase superfamily protein
VPDRWVTPIASPATLIGPATFRFLEEERDLDVHGWDDPTVSLLWRYNLHYFDDLNAAGASARRDWHEGLLARWVRENPPGTGTGWEPYPTSLRIVNWIKWSLGGGTPRPDVLRSVAVQAEWLSRRVEWHLLGNHLLANAKALVMAGLYFEGSRPARWLRAGLRILRREVPAQILSDGGHIERSPMYHAIVLEDLLDLWNASAAFGGGVPGQCRPLMDVCRTRIPAMQRWLAAMEHPDGGIGFFNDAAEGIAADGAALAAYALRLGFPPPEPPSRPVHRMPDSGYLRLAFADAVALLDMAPLGPDYLPAHGHADTLSFELSLRGSRVLVNSGTSQYGTGPERARQRGTSAHNTVVVNGLDSSEMWGGFRVGRRAQPDTPAVEATDHGVRVTCAHDGYTHLLGRPRHRRTWILEESRLVVEDMIEGGFESAEARFHLHPTVDVTFSDPDAVLALLDGRRARVRVEGGRLALEPATWHPRFGTSEATTCLSVRFVYTTVRTYIEWNA